MPRPREPDNQRRSRTRQTSPPATRRRASSLPSPDSVARDAPDQKFSFTDAFPFPGVILIIGFQGEGKTSLAYWIMDEYRRRSGGRTVGAVYKGTHQMAQWLPGWVARPQSVAQLPENSVTLITEAHQYAGARRSSSAENLEISHLAALARQKNSIIIFDTHHTRKLDLLDLGEAKRVIYKNPSFGQVMIERREVKPFTFRAYQKFEEITGDTRKHAYVVDFQRVRFGMFNVKQSPWWREELSTAMKDAGKGVKIGL